MFLSWKKNIQQIMSDIFKVREKSSQLKDTKKKYVSQIVTANIHQQFLIPPTHKINFTITNVKPFVS